VINQIRQKLKIPAAAVQVPIGIESDFKGVVDLVRWKALYNEGVKGYASSFYHTLPIGKGLLPRRQCSIDVVESDEIPEDVLELAEAKRQELIEALADVDDAIGDLYLAEEEVTTPDLVSAIRRATISLKFSPVFLGSAIKNTGVQPMLDGVCAYLPNPREASVNALDLDKPDPESSPVQLVPAAEAPLVGLAFKLEEGRYGQLTYMRVYQGSLKRGAIIYNARTGKKLKVPRLVKMHSNDMEASTSAFMDLYVLTRRSRTSMRLDLEKYVPFLAWSVHLATHLLTGAQTTPW
jgi:elongation factor G